MEAREHYWVSQAVGAMVAYNGRDGRRIGHAMKVYGYARAIAAGEKLTDVQRLSLELGAVLHDIGIHAAEEKYGSCSGRYQELEGPPIADSILTALEVPRSAIDRVCFLIAHHHSYDALDGPDFQILVEADFLVNIEEDNLGGEAVDRAREKIFRTRTGREILKLRFGTL